MNKGAKSKRTRQQNKKQSKKQHSRGYDRRRSEGEGLPTQKGADGNHVGVVVVSQVGLDSAVAGTQGGGVGA